MTELKNNPKQCPNMRKILSERNNVKKNRKGRNGVKLKNVQYGEVLHAIFPIGYLFIIEPNIRLYLQRLPFYSAFMRTSELQTRTYLFSGSVSKFSLV